MPRQLMPTPANFAQWIAGSDREIKREAEQGEQDHVRVMTVHGAKGLEARAVLLVDTVAVPDMGRELFSPYCGKSGITYPLFAVSDLAKAAPAWETARTAALHRKLQEYYRLLYVALTRPRDALHLFAMESPRRKISAASWYDTVRRAMQHLPDCTRQEDGSLLYADAGYVPPRAGVAPHRATASLPGWACRPPAVSRPVGLLSPSRLMDETLAPFTHRHDAPVRERGVLLHRVLQFLQAGSDRATIAALLAHFAPDWTSAQRSRAENEIWQLFRREHWLWEYPGQSEVTISGTLEAGGYSYPVSGQIDRLIDTEAALIVVDYKTGRDIPASAAETSIAYLLQLKLYVALLNNMYPNRHIRPAIVWTANASLMWLDEAVAQTGWEQAQLADE